jgi:hypothetical protein
MDIPDQFSRFISNKNDPFINMFMSEQNRDKLQNLIIKSVYTMTNGNAAIGKQSDRDLQIIMIQILQKNYDHRFSIQELNKIVVQTCSKNILANISNYTKYIFDLNNTNTSQSTFELITPQNTRESKEKSFKPLF